MHANKKQSSLFFNICSIRRARVFQPTHSLSLLWSAPRRRTRKKKKRSEMSEQRCHTRQPHFGWSENFFLSSFAVFLFFVYCLILSPLLLLFMFCFLAYSSIHSSFLRYFFSACRSVARAGVCVEREGKDQSLSELSFSLSLSRSVCAFDSIANESLSTR